MLLKVSLERYILFSRCTKGIPGGGTQPEQRHGGKKLLAASERLSQEYVVNQWQSQPFPGSPHQELGGYCLGAFVLSTGVRKPGLHKQMLVAGGTFNPFRRTNSPGVFCGCEWRTLITAGTWAPLKQPLKTT